MKKYLFIFLLSFIYFTQQAQYRKLPLDTNHIWQEIITIANQGPLVSCQYLLKSVKDSVVNNITYKYVRHISNKCYPAYESALLREDLILKRVIKYQNNTEQIIYNFNKNVGDTALLVDMNLTITTRTLQTKDSVMCSDGFYHRRFTYSGAPPMLEGIGSTSGLLTPWMGFETPRGLECLSKITPYQTVYTNGSVGSPCPIYNTSISGYSVAENLFVMFPNPASEILNILITNHSLEKIEIRNILGQTILELSKPNTSNNSINIANLVPGIYLVKVQLSDKIISRHFIKN